MEHPPTPTSPVEVKECIEELVRFTLQSSIDHILEFDLGLSTDFCSNLLRDDPCEPYLSQSTGFCKGILTYPLYKHLASALFESITSGSIPGKCENFSAFNEDDNLKQKEEWNQLLQSIGSELVTTLKTMNFELHVQEPFFTQLKDGLKTIEGRCAVGDYQRIGLGDLIIFNKCLVLQVQDVRQYNSFFDMLTAEGLTDILPGIKTIEDGVQVYRQFYSEEKEKSTGVLAICLSKFAAQPYIIMASLLHELSYGGVRSLLGLAHTAGTIPDALPPHISVLLSSFNSPYKENVIIH